MEIIKNINDFDVEYDFDINSQIKREQVSFTIYGLDPIQHKNKTVLGEIIVRGYNTELDTIEEKIMKMFESKGVLKYDQYRKN